MDSHLRCLGSSAIASAAQTMRLVDVENVIGG
jgi:hypothetical protein